MLAQKTTTSARAARHYKFALEAAKDRVYHKAILFTDKAIEIDKGFVEAYIVRGDIYSTVGKDSLAILDYKRALVLDPKFSFSLNYRVSGLEHKLGYFEDALKHINTYLTGKKIPDSYRRKALRKRKTYAFAVEAVNDPVIFQPMEMGDSINTLDDEYLPAISIFWLSVVTLLSVKLLIELYNVNKLPVQGTMPVNTALQIRFEGLVNKIGLTKKVTLLLSSKTDVPMAIGWIRPIVLLPASMITSLTPAQLDMLLLHELAHIRRHDYLVNLLQSFVEIISILFNSVVSKITSATGNGSCARPFQSTSKHRTYISCTFKSFASC